MKKLSIGFIGIIAFCVVLSFVLSGCSGGGGSSDSSGGWGGDSGGSSSSTATYTCSGRILNSKGTAVAGANCTLNSTSRGEKYINTVASDTNGNYSFTGVPAGSYTLRIIASGYVTVSDNFIVSGNKSENVTTVSKNDWDSYMGDANHPYDASYGYIQAVVSDTTSMDSSYNYQFSCYPMYYTSLGYLSTSNVIDWTAMGTFISGTGFFYKVSPGNNYTVSCFKSGSAIEPQTCGVNAGEITVLNFIGSISQ